MRTGVSTECRSCPRCSSTAGSRFVSSSSPTRRAKTAKRTWQGRRLNRTVHLVRLWCDGSAHGGCQADCKLFWNDAWLTSADANQPTPNSRALPVLASRCTEATLVAKTRQPLVDGESEQRYACQATMLFDATAPLAWWKLANTSATSPPAITRRVRWHARCGSQP